MRAKGVARAILSARQKYINRDIVGAVGDFTTFQFEYSYSDNFEPLWKSYSELLSLHLNCRNYGKDFEYDTMYERVFLQTFELAIRHSFVQPETNLEFLSILKELADLEVGFMNISRILYVGREVPVDMFYSTVVTQLVYFQQMYSLKPQDQVVALLTLKDRYCKEIDFNLLEDLQSHFPVIYEILGKSKRLSRPLFDYYPDQYSEGIEDVQLESADSIKKVLGESKFFG